MNVHARMAVSLDGYVAGPNARPGSPLGDGGTRLHEWMYGVRVWRELHDEAGGRTDRDNELLVSGRERTGATVLGRRMFDEGEEPRGPVPPFRMPVFVVTHQPREPLVREGGTTFTFVADGLQSAVEQAKAAAGGRDVEIGGGADVVQQCLVAGLLDELVLHVVPLFLGSGVRLFDRPELADVRLERTDVVPSLHGTTHLRFAVQKAS
jgi:dihydrofolate reductase